MFPVHVTACTAVSSVGVGCDPLESALRHKSSGLRLNDFDPKRTGGFIGRVAGIESQPLPQALASFECRNHRLAQAALGADGFDAAVSRASARYGADRVAVLVGTSTSGILTTEMAYRERLHDGALPAWFDYRNAHNYGALPLFVRERLGLSGPSQCLSTACSSSAKAIASAARWLSLGLCDAAVVGGVDSLCGTTLHGFHSLQVVSDTPCRPFDADRNGISLGEAAAFLLLEREPHEAPRGPVRAGGADRAGAGSAGAGRAGAGRAGAGRAGAGRAGAGRAGAGRAGAGRAGAGSADRRRVVFLGCGESADAWHMSAPHPQGLGAVESMRAALRHSGLHAGQIDFTCAHGTATRTNDEIESLAISAVLGEGAVVTSTKGTTGHTLGAAGALSAVVAVLAIERGFIPATANTLAVDHACPVTVPLQSRQQAVGGVLVNAFGFGGNNCSLVFGATA